MGSMYAIAICILVAFVSLPAVADETKDHTKTHTLESISISAPKLEEPAYSPYAVPESSKTATETFTQEEIEAIHPKSAFDVLDFGTGIITQFQGRKSQYSLQMRGSGSYGIILDGIYLTSSTSGRILQYLPIDIIEEVKIVRDSTVLTLGPLTNFTSPQGSPNQGFVVIKTKKPLTSEGSIRLGFSSFETGKFNTYYGNRLKNHYYDIAFSIDGTEGRKNYNNAQNAYSLFAKTGYTGKKLTADLTFFAGRAKQEIQRATPISIAYDARWKYDPIKTLLATFNTNVFWTDSQSTYLGVHYSDIKADLHTGSYFEPHVTTRNQKEHFRQIDLRHTINLFNSNTLKLGGQAISWHTPTGQFYYEGIERKEEIYGFFIQDEHSSFNDRLMIDCGARIDKKHISKGIDKYFPSPGTFGKVSLMEDIWAKDALNLSFGSAFKLNSTHKLSGRISYSKQGTASSIITVNNKTLDAETQLKYEAGITANYHKSFNSTLTAFRYDIKNFRYPASYVGPPDNVITQYDSYDVKREGIELSVNGQLARLLVFFANYSYIHSNRGIDNSIIPNHSGSLRIQHTIKNFETNLMAKFVGPYESNFLAKNRKYHGIGNFTRIDANINYNCTLFGYDTKITAYGRNITDKACVTRLGFKDIGATYGAELCMKF